ncbi:MAG: chorismate synthase, partial [Selenomonadaceae bacterium]
MGVLRFLTAGESHGQCLTAIVEGIPSGLAINVEEMNKDMVRRQQGYGRGDRM